MTPALTSPSLPVIVLLIAVIAPALIYLIQGIRDYPLAKTPDQYFLAGRQLSTLSLALNSVTSNFSFVTAVFVLLIWSYSYGTAVWWAILSGVIGFVLYAIPAISPIKDTAFLRTGTTLHEYLGNRYGSRSVRVIAAVPTISAFLGFFVAEIFIFATFLDGILAFHGLQLGLWTWIAILTVLNVIYAVLGGFRSVVRTDVWQLLFILLGLACLTWIVVHESGRDVFRRSIDLRGLFHAVPPFNSPPPLFIVALFIINGLWQFSAMDMWQRALAAGEQRRVARASITGGLIFGAIAIPVVLAGIAMRLKFPAGNLAPFDLIRVLVEGHHPLILGGLVALFGSASFAAVETVLIALSQSVLYDVKPSVGSPTVPSVLQARLTTVGLAVISIGGLYLYLRFVPFDLIVFLMTFFSCQIVLLPAIWYSVKRAGANPAAASIVGPPIPAIISISMGYAVAIVFGFVSLVHVELQAMIPVISLGVAFVAFYVALPFYEDARDS